MKYIRTKDGRIFYAKKKSKKDVKLANDNLHWKAIPKGCDSYFTLDYEDNEIIKVADTLEELIDEFVLIHTEYDNSKDIFEATHNGTWLQHRGDNYYSFGLEQVRSGNENITDLTLYGAIWTEWGLKYVAKMNDKGEMKLL